MILNRVTTLHYPIPDTKPVGTPPNLGTVPDEVRLEVIIDGRRYGVKQVLGDNWRRGYFPAAIINTAIDDTSRSMQRHMTEVLRDD